MLGLRTEEKEFQHQSAQFGRFRKLPELPKPFVESPIHSSISNRTESREFLLILLIAANVVFVLRPGVSVRIERHFLKVRKSCDKAKVKMRSTIVQFVKTSQCRQHDVL